MNASAPIDVARLIRIATLSFAVLAGTLVYFAFAPRVDALQMRLDDAESTLRSDEIAFSNVPRLRAERDALARRYANVIGQNAQAVFLRDLGATTRRHGLELVSTAIARDTSPASDDAAERLFTRTHVDLAWRGTYAHLLAGIDDLARGSALVRVDAPSLTRENETLVAHVPLTIYEPLAADATRGTP